MQVTILGKGNMGKAIGHNLEMGNDVSYYDSHDTIQQFGDLVILAVPYSELSAIAKQYQDLLQGKVVVDITNPLNFDTWDDLVVPANSSAAQQLQAALPGSKVVKAFNTNFAATLSSGKVGDNVTTVLMASDDDDAKDMLKDALAKSPLKVMDAGALKRARELEAVGFMQMTLAASKQIGWDGGFGINE